MTGDIEQEIETRDLQLSEMKDDAKTLLQELRETRSPTIREALQHAERGIKATEAKLRELAERRERLGTPFVVRRLNHLRDELLREEFNVAVANRAIKAAVDRIVIDPERARLNVHWRDSDFVSELPIWSRHATAFSDHEAS